MRHGNANRILSRTRRHRTALLRNLACSLVEHGKVHTTEAKAKELRPYVEKIITTAKTDSVANRRNVATQLGEPADTIIKKIFIDVAPQYRERMGGYTRIIKMGETKRGSRDAVIELV